MPKSGDTLSVIGYDSKLPEFLPLWAKSNGAELLSADGRKAQLNDPKVVEALTWAVSIYDEQGGFAAVKAYRDSADFFGAGNQFATNVLGAMPMEQWYVNVLNDVSPDAPIAFDTFRGKDGNAAGLRLRLGVGDPEGQRQPGGRLPVRQDDDRGRQLDGGGQGAGRCARREEQLFTGLLTGNKAADERSSRPTQALRSGEVGRRHRRHLRGEQPHVLAAGEPGRCRVQDRLAGRRQPGAERPAGSAGGARPGAAGGADRAGQGLGELGQATEMTVSEAGPATATPGPSRPNKRSWRRSEARPALLFISPWIVGFLIFTLWPVIYSAYLSLTDYDVINAPTFVGWANYQQLFTDPKIALSLKNTLFYTVVSVPLHVIVALALAMLLNQAGRATGFFRTAFFLPKMTPPVAVGVLLLLLLNGQSGLLNHVLGWFGIDGPSWTTDPNWVKPGLILMSLWTIGSTVIILLAALRDVPQDLYDAAMVDGAGPWQRTWYDHRPDDQPHPVLRRHRQHHRRVPDVHRGLHRLLRLGEQHLLQRRGAVLRDLPVPAGVRVPAHGLRVGDGVAAVRDHHDRHAIQVLVSRRFVYYQGDQR